MFVLYLGLRAVMAAVGVATALAVVLAALAVLIPLIIIGLVVIALDSTRTRHDYSV